MLVEVLDRRHTYIYAGGYTSQMTTYPPPTVDYEALFDNTDNTKYVSYLNYMLYNSAVLEYNSNVYVFYCFNAPSTLYVNAYDNGSYWTRQNTSLLGTLQSKCSSITVGGVSIVYSISASGSLVNTNLPVFTNPTDFMDYITNLAQPPYTWQSVPSISGKNGILELATIQSEKIDPWNTQKSEYDAGDSFSTPSRCNLFRFLQNLPDGVETTVVYCGDNYMTLTRTTNEYSSGINISGTLKLYLKTGIEVYSHVIAGYTRDTNVLSQEYLGFIIDTENRVANLDSVNVVEYFQSGQTQYEWNLYTDTGDTDLYEIYVWLQGSTFPEEKDPYEEGTTDDGGSDGYVTPQDHLGENDLPTVDGMNSGMFTVWLPDDSDILHISNFLWSNDVVSNILKYFNNVGECVLGFYVLPYVPQAGISSKKFKIGNLTDNDYTNVSYLTHRYEEVDCGSFELSSIWDSYLDFAPYTKLEIFLPFCGLHQLDVDELMCPARADGNLANKTGSTMSCKYRIDLLTGACVVYLKMDDEVRYQFSGKMGCQLPVTGNNYATMVQTLIQGVSSLASTVVSHSISAPYAQNPVAPTMPSQPASGGSKKEQKAYNKDMKQYNKDLQSYNNSMESRANKLGHSAGSATGAAVAGTISSMKPDVIRCGNLTGDASMIAYDRPYLIKTRPNKPKLSGQGKFTGWPSYKSGNVGSFSGYNEFLKVHLTNIPCTGNEQEEIENFLKGGVIINPSTERSPEPDVTPTVSGNLVIVFLKMTSEVNVLGKKWSSEQFKTEGKLIYDQSVTTPIILINGDCTGYNYAYIPFFHRYYYIGDYVVTRQLMQEVHMFVDSLQSFITEIEACEGIVSRSENKPNYYINDGVFYTEQRTVTTYHCFKKDGDIVKFDTQQMYFITAGG